MNDGDNKNKDNTKTEAMKTTTGVIQKFTM